MIWHTLILAVLGCLAVLLLTGRPPLSLSGKKRAVCVVCGCLANFFPVFSDGITTVPMAVSRAFLVNVIFWMAAIDAKEKNIYKTHFYLLLAGGLISAFFQPETKFWELYLMFALLLAMLTLVSKKRKGLSGADSRVIATLALYFTFSQWIELMILSLGIALLYGVVFIIRKKRSLRTEIPFVPFLLAGILLELL